MGKETEPIDYARGVLTTAQQTELVHNLILKQGVRLVEIGLEKRAIITGLMTAILSTLVDEKEAVAWLESCAHEIRAHQKAKETTPTTVN